MTEPVLRYVDDTPPRLKPSEPGPDPAETPAADPAPRWGTPSLVLGGAAVLALGFALLGTVDFVAGQFARAPWLGWLTLAVAVLGFGLMFAGLWRELRALWALDHVDGLRAALASGNAPRIMAAARDWAARVPGGEAVLPALRAVNDPDAAIALLRAGPGASRLAASEALSRRAAVQAVAGVAAMPSPALDVLFVAWRGVRLIRQVAALYGVRPGLLATLSLLRRTALSATLVGAAELAGNTAAHALLTSPLLAKAVGETAGLGLAARRMLVLGRAAATACTPLPPP